MFAINRIQGGNERGKRILDTAERGNLCRPEEGVGRIRLDDEDHRPDLALHGDPRLERPPWPPRLPPQAADGVARPPAGGRPAAHHRHAEFRLRRDCRDDRLPVQHGPDDAHGRLHPDGPRADPGGDHPGAVGHPPAEGHAGPHRGRRRHGPSDGSLGRKLHGHAHRGGRRPAGQPGLFWR